MAFKYVSDLPCMHCEYMQGRVVPDVIYSGPNVFVLLNATNRSKGAVVLFPVRHVPTIAEATSEEVKELNLIIHCLTDVILSVYQPEGLHTWCSSGEAAGQSEAHFHFQIAPRYRDQDYSFDRTNSLRIETAEERRSQVKKICDALQKFSKISRYVAST